MEKVGIAQVFWQNCTGIYTSMWSLNRPKASRMRGRLCRH